jgi:hypothetical protein
MEDLCEVILAVISGQEIHLQKAAQRIKGMQRAGWQLRPTEVAVLEVAETIRRKHLIGGLEV